MRLTAALLLTASLLLTACKSAVPFEADTTDKEVTFLAIGCGPYKPQEETDLKQYIALENDLARSDFLIHLGDIMSGGHPGPRSYYANVAGILKRTDMPSFIVVGDNEWNDKPDHAKAWSYWERYFMRFDEHWNSFGSHKKMYPTSDGVQRQVGREENFAFVRKGVLFIGLNLPGGYMHDAEEWARRLPANAAWVKENYQRYGSDVRAAVILAQAMIRPVQEPFFAPFRAASAEFAKPVLYLHADGHSWIKDEPWPEKNILRVQTDMLGIAPPLLVTVKEQADGLDIFQFNRQYLRKPYLAQATPNSMHIVWRTQSSSTPGVRFGLSPDALDQAVPAKNIVSKTFEHTDPARALHSAPEGIEQFEAAVTGLAPNTTYYYAVYDGDERLSGGDETHHFTTHPLPGTDAPMRFWVVGDSGKGNQDQYDVHAAMRDYVRKQKHPLDFFIHVGDMAYGKGLDHEFHNNFFKPYEDTLRNTPTWAAMGNHEGATSDGKTGVGPYYDAYVLPTKAQAGGLASGTEAYYSFDYGKAHFICLNSHDLDRSPTAAMAKWLAADLEQTKSDWIFAFWHHPPYTKGSHDSDLEEQLIEMRENIMPILEAGGVDITFTGHSHIYERSMLIDGAYATPTVAEGVVLDDGDGNPDGDGAYRKSAGIHPHEGAVAIVAGHGGTSVSRRGTSPVMRYVAFPEHGSVIVDVNGDTTHAIMLNSKGKQSDVFEIVKRGKVAPTRVANPFQLPMYINFNYIKANVTLSNVQAKGTPAKAKLTIPAIDKRAQATLVWDTTNTSWQVEPATAALVLSPHKESNADFSITINGDIFPLATPGIVYHGDDGKETKGQLALNLPPYRTTTIGRMKAAPKIDGVISESEIAGLEKQKDMIEYNGKGLAGQDSEFYLGIHGNNLYIAVVNHEPEMDNMTLMQRKFDGPIWQDDCDEIFFQRQGSDDYYQYVVSAAGVLYDGKNGYMPGDVAWNGKWESKVTLAKDRWFAEFSISLDELGPAFKPGDVLRFNFCRNNPTHENEYTQWSHTNKQSSHVPEYFGAATVGK